MAKKANVLNVKKILDGQKFPVKELTLANGAVITFILVLERLLKRPERHYNYGFTLFIFLLRQEVVYLPKNYKDNSE